MKLSARGLSAIKTHEGLRLKAYPDPGSSNGLPITIGYGSTRNPDGGEWHLADEITEARAEELLRFDLQDAERAVSSLVKVPLRQSQYDALVSFVFNVGDNAFEASTLLSKINANDPSAADEFMRWIHNDGKPMEWLKRRRQSEREMFLQPAPIIRKDTEMSPFIAAAWPLLRDAIPALIRSFGDGPMTERNADAIEKVFGVVQATTGAPNAQAAIEAVKADPAIRATVTEALDREGWFMVTEAGGGGIAGARKFHVEATQSDNWLGIGWAIVLGVLAIGVVIGGGIIMGILLFDAGIDKALAAQILDYYKAAGFIVLGYAFGSSVSSRKKDDVLARNADQQ